MLLCMNVSILNWSTFSSRSLGAKISTASKIRAAKRCCGSRPRARRAGDLSLCGAGHYQNAPFPSERSQRVGCCVWIPREFQWRFFGHRHGISASLCSFKCWCACIRQKDQKLFTTQVYGVTHMKPRRMEEMRIFIIYVDNLIILNKTHHTF